MLSKIPYRTHNPHLHRKIDQVNRYIETRGKRDDGVVMLDACPPFPEFYSQPEVIHFKRKGSQIYGDKVASQLINFQSDLLASRV